MPFFSSLLKIQDVTLRARGPNCFERVSILALPPSFLLLRERRRTFVLLFSCRQHSWTATEKRRALIRAEYSQLAHLAMGVGGADEREEPSSAPSDWLTATPPFRQRGRKKGEFPLFSLSSTETKTRYQARHKKILEKDEQGHSFFFSSPSLFRFVTGQKMGKGSSIVNRTTEYIVAPNV